MQTHFLTQCCHSFQDGEKYADEVEALRKESEMSLDDILDTLPPEMIKHLSSLERKASADVNVTDEEDSRLVNVISYGCKEDSDGNCLGEKVGAQSLELLMIF